MNRAGLANTEICSAQWDKMLGDSVDAVRSVSHDRVQQQTAEHIVDQPFLQIREEFVEEVAFSPDDCAADVAPRVLLFLRMRHDATVSKDSKKQNITGKAAPPEQRHRKNKGEK